MIPFYDLCYGSIVIGVQNKKRKKIPRQHTECETYQSAWGDAESKRKAKCLDAVRKAMRTVRITLETIFGNTHEK